MTDYVMPDLAWLEKEWGSKPGSLGWIVEQDGEQYDTSFIRAKPGTLHVQLARWSYLANKGWCRPYRFKDYDCHGLQESIDGKTPEEVAALAIRCARVILENVNEDLPKKTDVNGLGNVRQFGEGITHT